MVEIVEPIRGHEVTGQQRDAQWITVFAHYFVTQQHVQITTPRGTTKESVVTRVNHASVDATAIYGATQQILFAGITNVRRIGTAELALEPRIRRDIDQLAAYMARGEYLRLETVNGVIEKAAVRHIILLGITIADRRDGGEIFVPFTDITHMQPTGTV